MGIGKILLVCVIVRESGFLFVFVFGVEFVEFSIGNGFDKIFDIFFIVRVNVSFWNLCVVLSIKLDFGYNFCLEGNCFIFDYIMFKRLFNVLDWLVGFFVCFYWWNWCVGGEECKWWCWMKSYFLIIVSRVWWRVSGLLILWVIFYWCE